MIEQNVSLLKNPSLKGTTKRKPSFQRINQRNKNVRQILQT